jgi:transcriptional regulator with XRE-family HTH domain
MACRLAAGMTKAQLAARAGIAVSTLWALETTACAPREETLLRLTNVLGVVVEGGILAPGKARKSTQSYQ